MGKRVVVIGGGVIGLSCAYFLAKDGHEVVVLDRGQPDSERCSSGNGGIVCPSHFVPLAAPGVIAMGLKMMFNPRGPFRIKPSLDPHLLKWAWLFRKSASQAHVDACAPILRDLSLHSRRLYVDLAREMEFGFCESGLLSVCQTPERLAHEAELAHKAVSIGLQAEVLDADGLRKADPGIRYEAAGAVLFPQDGYLDPARYMECLGEKISAAGGEIVYGVDASEIYGSGCVRTSAGQRFEGDTVVLAAGSWSPRLAVDPLPMQAGKGYSFTVDQPRELPHLTSLLIEGRLAVTPIGGKLRVSGTMEIAGTDLSVNTKRLDGIVESFCRFCPAYSPSDFANLPVWKGLRPVTPDGMPYIGRFRSRPSVIAATGHAMMGVSLAPVTGKLVADIVAGREPDIDLARCDPGRFA